MNNLNQLYKKTIVITDGLDSVRLYNLSSSLRRIGLDPETYQASEVATLVAPAVATFTLKELSELLAFYHVIDKAYKERVSPILVIRDTAKLFEKSIENIPTMLAQTPPLWDLFYYMSSARSLKLAPDPIDHNNKKLVLPVWWARGCFAVGINHPFYHLFLEKAAIPTANLDDTIKSMSAGLNIFMVNPPLFTL